MLPTIQAVNDELSFGDTSNSKCNIVELTFAMASSMFTLVLYLYLSLFKSLDSLTISFATFPIAVCCCCCCGLHPSTEEWWMGPTTVSYVLRTPADGISPSNRNPGLLVDLRPPSI